MSSQVAKKIWGIAITAMTASGILFAVFAGKETIQSRVAVSDKIFEISLILGILVMLVGLVALAVATTIKIYIFIRTKRTKEYDINSARPFELKVIHRLAKKHISSSVSPQNRMLAWQQKNADCFQVVRENYIYPNGKINSKIVGYYAILPVNKDIAESLLDGRITGLSINVDDIEESTDNAYGLYIGGIVSKGGYKSRVVVRELAASILQAFKGQPEIVIAKAVTSDGERLLKHHGFSKCHHDPQEGSVYKLRQSDISRDTWKIYGRILE